MPTKAPTVGEHTDQVLAEVLGYDDAKVAALRDAGALGLVGGGSEVPQPRHLGPLRTRVRL